MGELTLQEQHQVVVNAIRTLARLSGAKTYVFVVAGDGHVFKSVSPDLKAHERGFVDEVEKARANPIVVWEEGNISILRRAEEALAKTKHAELHPIVAVMIDSLNKLNGHKVSRSTALKDSSSTPTWWPHSPKKYAERTQQLNIRDLTLVIDAVLDQVRNNAVRIEKLRHMLASHFKAGSCSVGTRAVFDAYFDFLLDEACRSETGVLMSNASLANASREFESPEVSPRLSVCGNQSQASGLPALQVSRASNVHRPLPILQPVPECTTKKLCVPLTGEETKGLDLRALPARQTSAEAADLPTFSSKEGLASALWSPSILSTRDYVELGERRKRARTDAVFAEPDWSSYSAPAAASTVPGFYNRPPCIEGATVEGAHESKWPEVVENGAFEAFPGVTERPSAVKTESGAADVEQCADRVTEALQQLAQAERAQGCIWMLFGGSGGRRVWCSPRLTPVTEALVEGLEVAISSRLQDAPVDGGKVNASNVLRSLVRSPSPSESTSPSVVLSEGPSKLRADLAVVVEALVRGMNRITSSQGLPAPSTIPDWFPYPTKYWTIREEMEKAELLHVLDVVFQKARREYFHIRELKAQWHASQGELHNTELRRAVDAYLDGLEMEATAVLPRRVAV
ncbi:hypothetical protein KFL_004720100 [Klebsormidium nitens]|uniref:Uncharacterized protein n=1 Tax=Klebsormidium nitens TaxID=105231 RepID=A0A0U9I7V3_KLENI|nr:hypothetical protein KFL_004720100 [Klebsormidium nitens]|eukprot:GAQ88951.1 hypothetical protein KFL_004720100 [Klebsormidium nitens]